MLLSATRTAFLIFSTFAISFTRSLKRNDNMGCAASVPVKDAETVSATLKKAAAAAEDVKKSKPITCPSPPEMSPLATPAKAPSGITMDSLETGTKKYMSLYAEKSTDGSK
jgi:hypothetical protein